MWNSPIKLMLYVQGAQSMRSDTTVSAYPGEAPMRGVVRSLVASSGSGCEAVLLGHSTAGQAPCWTTRYLQPDMLSYHTSVAGG